MKTALSRLSDNYDDRHFYQALLLSLALHVVLLMLFPVRQTEQSATAASAALHVTLANMGEATESSPQHFSIVGKADVGRIEILSTPEPSSVALPAKQKSKAPDTRLKVMESGSGKEIQKATATGSDSPQTDSEVRHARKPGEATMMIEIAEDGSVGQIIWGRLPAMNRVTLERLEAAIRARVYKYPSGNGFIKETIDVRDYLESLPP